MFGQIFSESYRVVFQNISVVFRVILFWTAFVFMVSSVNTFILSDTIEFGWWIVILLNWMASASISVAWIRFLFLGEVPNVLHFRFLKIELLFFIKILLFKLAFYMPIIVKRVLSYDENNIDIYNSIIIFAIYAVGVIVPAYLYLKLVFIFPATALNKKLSLREAGRLSRGLRSNIFFSLILVILPIVFLAWIVNFVLGTSSVSGDEPANIANEIISSFVNSIWDILWASVIAAAYRIAMERQASGGQT